MTFTRMVLEVFHLGMVSVLLWMVQRWVRVIAPVVLMFIRGQLRDYRTLMIGSLVVMYLGFFIDNLYWGTTWRLNFWGHPAAESMIHNGPLGNIVWRAGAGILAVYGHLLAEDWLARERGGRESNLARRTFIHALWFASATMCVDVAIKLWIG